MLSTELSRSFPSLNGIDLQPPRPAAALRTFRHEFDIYLKDSNAYTNTYFSRYFEWQGVCRERWFHQCVAKDFLQSEGVFITKRAHTEYLQETYPFQNVECELNTWDVRHCSFHLLFRFSVAGAPVATGFQQVVFARHDKRIQRLPADVLDRIREFEVQQAPALN
jgi:acyl-CoA thioesterase FadM